MKTFDLSKLTVVFDGIDLTPSYAKGGDAVKLTMEEDAFKKTVGGSGEVARIRNNNQSGSLAVKLMQTSSINALLSAKLALDRAAGGGFGALLIKDQAGTTLGFAQNAWIKKLPETSFGDEVAEREWVFDFEKMEGVVVGGNS